MRTPWTARTKAPSGYANLRTGGFSTDTQTTHLVRRNENGGTHGPTLCGLTRFDRRDPETYALIEAADLGGWSVEGGLFGPGINQVQCTECARYAFVSASAASDVGGEAP